MSKPGVPHALRTRSPASAAGCLRGRTPPAGTASTHATSPRQGPRSRDRSCCQKDPSPSARDDRGPGSRDDNRRNHRTAPRFGPSSKANAALSGKSRASGSSYWEIRRSPTPFPNSRPDKFGTLRVREIVFARLCRAPVGALGHCCAMSCRSQGRARTTS